MNLYLKYFLEADRAAKLAKIERHKQFEQENITGIQNQNIKCKFCGWFGIRTLQRKVSRYTVYGTWYCPQCSKHQSTKIRLVREEYG